MSRRPRLTGGQYSLGRALLGACLAGWSICRIGQVLARPDATALFVAALVLVGACALLVAAGWHDRAAAAIALAAGTVLCSWDPALGSPALLAFGWLLLAHLFVPSAPYGSIAARGRPDPGGGWHLPLPIWIGTWVVLVAGAAAQIGAALQTDGRGMAAASGWGAGLMLLLFAIDPGWIGGRGGAAPETLFYDGDCGLCHRAVRFLLAEDPAGRRFRFAPLQGAHFRATLTAAQRQDLPDSLVLLTEGGRVLTRSRAVRHGLLRLGGYWSVLGWIGSLLPPAIGDAAYNLVARTRHRLFSRPPDACPVTPPHLRERFNLD